MLLRALRRLSMSSGPPRRPLLVVAGATGTGKSQLAVYLAERFNGEIINGDALQMYKGLPIATNKPSAEERRGIPHHLLGCVGLDEESWTVQHFHDKASSILEDIRSRGKLPVLVGGTQYYVQSLLFPKSLLNDDDEKDIMAEADEEQQWPILEADSGAMLAELTRLDPEMAKSWHPSDRRKIRRSLMICLQTGKKASDVYREQRESILTEHMDRSENLGVLKDHAAFETGPILSDSGNLGNATGPDVLVFWTYSSSETLNQQLDKRVDRMLSRGLLDEVQSMHDFRQAQAQQPGGYVVDDTRGIWIAIGCKELLPYVVARSLSATDDEAAEQEKKKQEGIDRMKIATRQYAKRQNRWMRRRLLPAMKDAGLEGNVFLLDATTEDTISQHSSPNVEGIASGITRAFLAGDSLPVPVTLSAVAREVLLQSEEAKETRCARYCEPCGKTVMFESEWLMHLQSKGHKKAVKPKVDWKALYPEKVVTKDD